MEVFDVSHARCCDKNPEAALRCNPSGSTWTVVILLAPPITSYHTMYSWEIRKGADTQLLSSSWIPALVIQHTVQSGGDKCCTWMVCWSRMLKLFLCSSWCCGLLEGECYHWICLLHWDCCSAGEVYSFWALESVKRRGQVLSLFCPKSKE